MQRKEVVVEKLKERMQHQEAELAIYQVEVVSLEVRGVLCVVIH